MGLRQAITLFLDPDTQSKLAQDFRAAGAKGIDALKAEFATKMADLKYDFSKGLIDERTFKDQSKRVADTFDKEVRGAMDRLVDSGKAGTEEYRRLGAEIKSVGREAGPMQALWGRAKSAVIGLGASIAAAFTVRAIVDFSKELFRLGMNAEETASKFNTTFGAGAAEATAFLDDFANKAGLSTQQGQDFLATIGAMVQGMGATAAASVPMSQQILKLAGDLQSFHNVPIEQTFTALRSGLVGEYEPLRRFGIVLTAATVEMKAMEMTGKTNAATLTALEKSQAALTLATEKMGPALGDLNRTSDSTSNTLRRMNAEWVDFKTRLGEAMVEGINASGIIGGMGDQIGSLNEWFDRNRETIVAWVSTIADFVGTGVRHITRIAVGTKNELAAIGSFLSAFWRHVQREWIQLQIGFMGVSRVILDAVGGLLSALSTAARALGLEGLADTLQRGAQQSTRVLNDLAVGIKTKEREWRALWDDPAATKTTTLGGSIAANVEAGGKKAGTALDGVATASGVAAAKAAEKWEAFQVRFRASMDNSVAAANKAQGEILDSLESYLGQHERAYRTANTQRLKDLATTTAAEDTIRENALREEMARLNRVLQSTTATEAEKRHAFERTTEIQAELDARAARSTLEAADRQADSHEAAQERIRQALVDSGMTSEEVAEVMEEAGTGAATGTKTSWLEAAGVMVNALQNLGNVTGGVFGKIVGGIGGIVSGLTTAVSGFKAFQSVTEGGLSGLIQKVAGLAGGFGGVIAVASQLPGIIKGAVGLLGDVLDGLGIINRNKDPGRFSSNNEAYLAAVNGGAFSKDGFTNPLEFLLAKSPESKGGQGGWATTDAQNDAWRKLMGAIVQLNRRGAVPEQFRQFIDDALAYKFHAGGVIGREPRLHGGGWLRPNERRFIGEVGEIVLPVDISQRLAQIVAGGAATPLMSSSSHNEDNRALAVTVNLSGVHDREIPRAVAQAVIEAAGREYQDQSALQGNTRVGR